MFPEGHRRSILLYNDRTSIGRPERASDVEVMPSRHDWRIYRAPARYVDRSRHVEANSPNVAPVAAPLAQKIREPRLDLGKDLYRTLVDVENLIALFQHFPDHVAEGDPHACYPGVGDQQTSQLAVELEPIGRPSARACAGASRANEPITQQTFNALVEGCSR